MKFDLLKVYNFRNYESLSLKFSPKLNIIYGKNGSGKTNVVEALYVLALTKSFRTKDDLNIIKKGEISTRIEAKVITDSVNDYQIIINEDGKKVKINNIQELKLSNYISNINIVLFQPDDQMLLKLAPSVRRKMINIEISQLNKEYINYLNDYNRILKQRNFYLRELYINGNASREYLNILTKKLIEYGKKIYDMRKDFIDKINEYINISYHNIFESGELKIKYISDYNKKNEEELFNIYNKNYNKEIILGKTSLGIHHDDIVFLLDNQNISEWGSNGQRKNAIFAFKLAEIEVFKSETGNYPILILDDLFSALDNNKIKNIVKLLNNSIQTFITTTELERIDDTLLSNAKLFNVTYGNIKEV